MATAHEYLMNGFGWFLQGLAWALMLLRIIAFADAAIRPGRFYTAAGKQKQPFWLILLALSVLLDFTPLAMPFIGAIGIVDVAGMVVAIVYWVDVRPAVRELAGAARRNGNGRGGNGSGERMGPYGPW